MDRPTKNTPIHNVVYADPANPDIKVVEFERLDMQPLTLYQALFLYTQPMWYGGNPRVQTLFNGYRYDPIPGGDGSSDWQLDYTTGILIRLGPVSTDPTKRIQFGLGWNLDSPQFEWMTMIDWLDLEEIEGVDSVLNPGGS